MLHVEARSLLHVLAFAPFILPLPFAPVLQLVRLGVVKSESNTEDSFFFLSERRKVDYLLSVRPYGTKGASTNVVSCA